MCSNFQWAFNKRSWVNLEKWETCIPTLSWRWSVRIGQKTAKWLWRGGGATTTGRQGQFSRESLPGYGPWQMPKDTKLLLPALCDRWVRNVWINDPDANLSPSSRWSQNLSAGKRSVTHHPDGYLNQLGICSGAQELDSLQSSSEVLGRTCCLE